MCDSETARRLLEDGWEVITDPGFIGLIGPFFRKDASSGARYCFPTKIKHNNRGGVVQGGALMTFADRALGAAARSATGATQTATVQFSFQFVDAVKIGEIVEAEPVVVRATRRLIFMNTTLNVGIRTVGLASGIWKKSAGRNLSPGRALTR